MDQSFYQVVTEAVRYFEEHGFQSAEVLQQWVDRIRKAAVETLTPESVLNEELKRSLGGIYKRLIDDGQILKTHQGVGKFTIERLKPKLRADLDRRLMVSRSLIKLNREQAVEKAVQRMAGWASSIPAGGSKAVEVKETKDHIRKALTSLPFEERRCIIDQSAKFVASLNDIIAVDGGAIAMRWHIRHSVGYHNRPDHKEREGNIYLFRQSWAREKGYVKPGPDGYYDDITKVGEEVYCFPGDSKIPYAGLVEKAFRRWYEGALTEIVTDSGKTIRATPNHPVLTSAGWKAIGSLNEGDDIIEVADELIKPLEENQYHGVASISEIFGAVEENGIVETLDLRPTDFHGDGRHGDVDVVLPARELTFDFMTAREKSLNQFGLTETNGTAPGSRSFAKRLFAALGSAKRGVSIGNQRSLLFARHLGHAIKARCHVVSELNASLFKAVRDWCSGNAEAFGNGQHTFAAEVGIDDRFGVERQFVGGARSLGTDFEAGRIHPIEESPRFDAEDVGDFRDGLPFAAKLAHVVKVNRSWFSGHVFNLQTEHSLYVVNGIIAHNCSCYAEFIYHLRDLPEDMLTVAGKAALQEARAKIAAMRT